MVGAAKRETTYENLQMKKHQRDQEEAQWEAVRPKREAEEKQRKEDASDFEDTVRYDLRLVAFLDVFQ